MLVVAAGLVGACAADRARGTGSFFAWASSRPARPRSRAGSTSVPRSSTRPASGPRRRAFARGRRRRAVAVVLAVTIAHLDVFDFSRLQAWAWVVAVRGLRGGHDRLAVTASYARPPGPRLPRGRARALRLGRPRARGCRRRAVDRSGRVRAPPARRPLRRSWAAMLAVLAAWPAVGARPTRPGSPRSRSSCCRPARSPPPRGRAPTRPTSVSLVALVGVGAGTNFGIKGSGIGRRSRSLSTSGAATAPKSTMDAGAAGPLASLPSRG